MDAWYLIGWGWWFGATAYVSFGVALGTLAGFQEAGLLGAVVSGVVTIPFVAISLWWLSIVVRYVWLADPVHAALEGVQVRAQRAFPPGCPIQSTAQHTPAPYLDRVDHLRHGV